MAQMLMVNPRKRRAPAKRRTRRAAPANKGMPVRRRRRAAAAAPAKRRYRRNPIRGNKVMDQVKSGAIGAAGAIALDIAWAKLPIPAAMQTGMMAPVAKAGGAIALGMLVGKFGKNRTLGRQLAEGGVTVALHGLMAEQVSKVVPLDGYNGGLLGYDDTLLGMEDLGFGRVYDTGSSPTNFDTDFSDLGYAGAGNVFDSSGDY